MVINAEHKDNLPDSTPRPEEDIFRIQVAATQRKKKVIEGKVQKNN